MRLVFACWLVVAQLLVSDFASVAGDGSGLDSGTAKRIRESVNSGDNRSAISELRSLPTDQRLEWLSQLHQNGGDERNPNGGAAIADYTELIGLIENVIDAEWVVNGGSASLNPYRQGVRINPNGLIERFDPSEIKTISIKPSRTPDKEAKPANITLSNLGEWQQSSSLRWISLHQLDEQVAAHQRSSKGSRATIAMELLGGLYRIDYVAYDKESREWFIGGPAGDLVTNESRELLNLETGLPPVLLEDLLGVAPHVLREKGEFGCSIDPDPIRLKQAYEMVRSVSAMRTMQRQPEQWAEQWREKLGRQNAKVIGLRQDSPTGYALLIADAHMKRLGLGLEARPTHVKTYWQEKETFTSSGSGTDQSMVRWWFSLTDHKIPMDPDRKIYHFANSNVRVLSEGQLMNEKGERIATQSPDLAAETFARKFTRHFERLQRDYPVYGRLRHIFDLSVALEIVRHEMEAGNGKRFLAIDNPSVQPRLQVTPRELDSVAATHRLQNGQMSAMISGGVSIHQSKLADRLVVDKTQTNKVAIESSNDSSKSTSTDDESSVTRIAGPTLQPRRDKPFWK
jgi:hypothetical protein